MTILYPLGMSYNKKERLHACLTIRYARLYKISQFHFRRCYYKCMDGMVTHEATNLEIFSLSGLQSLRLV